MRESPLLKLNGVHTPAQRTQWCAQARATDRRYLRRSLRRLNASVQRSFMASVQRSFRLSGSGRGHRVQRSWRDSVGTVLCSLSGEHPVAQPQLSAQRAGYPRAPQFREEPSNAQMRSTNAPQSREGPWKATNAFNICALVPPGTIERTNTINKCASVP